MLLSRFALSALTGAHSFSTPFDLHLGTISVYQVGLGCSGKQGVYTV